MATFRSMNEENLGSDYSELDLDWFRNACQIRQIETGETDEEVTAWMWGPGDWPIRAARYVKSPELANYTSGMTVSVGIDPIDLDQNGDLLDEDRLVAAVKDFLEERWPEATVKVQVGIKAVESWYRIDGKDSPGLRIVVSVMDWSEESLYARGENQ